MDENSELIICLFINKDIMIMNKNKNNKNITNL